MVRLRCFTPVVAFLSLAILAPAQTTTYTWTGNAVTAHGGSASADASNALNWDSAPPAGGSATTQLVFGASNGLGGESFLQVLLPYSFEVYGITVSTQMPHYSFEIDDGGTLRLGAGGLNLTDSYGYGTGFRSGTLELLASQTWTINSNLYVSAAIASSGSHLLTQTGNSLLTLANANSTFSGGMSLQDSTAFQGSTLQVGASSTWDATNSVITRGPVGTGRLTLGSYTTLRSDSSDGTAITLHNPITLGNHVTIGSSSDGSDRFTLAGDITPTAADTTVHLDLDGALFVKGAIGNIAGGTATSLTFARPESVETLQLASSINSDNFPVVVLTGNNTYTGKTTANDAGVIFYTSGALGQTSAIQSINGGYVGTGYNGGMTAILAKIDTPSRASFDGALGFDTDPDLSAIATTFADAINLTDFTNDTAGPTSGFWGLGSMTSATLTGTITPPTGGNYVFGGGSGKLYVQSNLGVPSNSTGAGVRVRTLYGDDPLTVYLQGANTFTGNLLSDHSIVVLDSATALPTGTSFSMDSGAYVGYTENFTAGGTGPVTPTQFISRLAGSSYNTDSVLGFDTAAANLPAGRTIADAIDLSAFTAGIFIGTSTHVHLASDAIKAPATSMLSVTGVNGGWLTLDGKLQTGNLTSLYVGNSGSDALGRGYVEITNALNNYTGGTTLKSGYLLLGASSTVSGGTITQGPLGTGHLEIEGFNTPALVATTANVTLHNNVTFDPYTSFRLGAPITTDTADTAYPVQAFTAHGLTLAGALSGNQINLSVRGNATFTLAGENSALTNTSIQVGGYNTAEGSPRIVADTNTALGATSNYIALMSGADLQFTSAAPSIGSIYGGYKYDTDPDASFIALAPNSNLTINQTITGYLYANIGGAPADFSGTATAAVNAALTKNGAATLHLFGNNTYSGGTTINSGLVIAGSTSALGTGTITLNGGGVGAVSGITFANPIAFGANGGTLGGSGAFNTHFTIGTNVKLAPGSSPGVLTFTNGLTLDTGGMLSIDLVDLHGTAGVGYDQLKITAGTFALNGTDGGFVIQLNSLTSTYGGIGPLTTDFSTPAALTLIDSVTPLNLADLAKLSLNTTNFTTYQPGEFSLSLSADSTDLILNFTPVPEPSTYALMGLGLLAIAGSTWRRNRARRD